MGSSEVVVSDKELLSDGIMSSGKITVAFWLGFFPHRIRYSFIAFSISWSFFTASV